jgi:hypothetical protein
MVTREKQSVLASLDQFFKIITNLLRLCTFNQHQHKLVNFDNVKDPFGFYLKTWDTQNMTSKEFVKDMKNHENKS